ncbi:hypothetical protein TW95_gp0357 [Pandoravirus inopinatum]|uniref:Uncharacterized protein n=1 Tax=Pandoravirus inopinatum TaxID=1605721 RepID=A0A0B5J8H3_9VIRU|nr:hypothetical protein TW95_gp0357 [Pandoravirus inopinatum]AJF97091.1 hypothetical protein [Pandoravirus inopinatum]
MERRRGTMSPRERQTNRGSRTRLFFLRPSAIRRRDAVGLVRELCGRVGVTVVHPKFDKTMPTPTATKGGPGCRGTTPDEKKKVDHVARSTPATAERARGFPPTTDVRKVRVRATVFRCGILLPLEKKGAPVDDAAKGHLLTATKIQWEKEKEAETLAGQEDAGQ